LETTPASCTGAGELRRDCNNCDHYETDVIPQFDHADEDSNNSCDTCGKTMSEGSDNNNGDNNTDNSGNGDNATDNDGDNNTVIIVILCVVVGVAAIAAVGVVIFKKKRS
jgi:hypothetical protein